MCNSYSAQGGFDREKDSFLDVKTVKLCSIPPQGTPVIQAAIRYTEFKMLSFSLWWVFPEF